MTINTITRYSIPFDADREKYFNDLSSDTNGEFVKFSDVQEILYNSITWSVEDVFQVANNMNVELSNESCQEILDKLIDKHDSNIGINLVVIEAYIECYLLNNN